MLDSPHCFVSKVSLNPATAPKQQGHVVGSLSQPQAHNCWDTQEFQVCVMPPVNQMVQLGDDRWTPSGIGAGRGWEGESQRADGVGKELSVAGEAKGMLRSRDCSSLWLPGRRGQDVRGLFS